jgi:hypothetical protein
MTSSAFPPLPEGQLRKGDLHWLSVDRVREDELALLQSSEVVSDFLI